MDEKKTREKRDTLLKNLMELPSILVAFSGGTDSAFLLAAATQALGHRVLAATAHSVIHSKDELEQASLFARKLEVEHIIFESDELGIEEFKKNSSDRCYHCKKALVARLKNIADEKGIRHVAHAVNTDDLNDYRPGIKAAEEMGLIAPLVKAGLDKEEIRFLSKEMGIETWDRPSNACLASRIPYGSPVTPEKLKMIDEAERFLRQIGFRQTRVRHHEDTARIEVEAQDISRFVNEDIRAEVVEKLKETGFKHVALDLEGYVSGSMNRTLKD